MPKKTSDQIVVDGWTWQRQWLDDRSGSWFQVEGKFGELCVERNRDENFTISWWPPGIRTGDSTIIGFYTTQRRAMKAGQDYLAKLFGLLDGLPGSSSG